MPGVRLSSAWTAMLGWILFFTTGPSLPRAGFEFCMSSHGQDLDDMTPRFPRAGFG